MTIASLRPVACQKCRQENQVETCDSINSHDRHLHDKLISGALWYVYNSGYWFGFVVGAIPHCVEVLQEVPTSC
jgi:hypothetical protein